LSDHEQGVLCQDGPQRVLGVLRQNGFTLQKQTTSSDKALWTLVQNGDAAAPPPHQPVEPQPTPSGDAEESGDNQGENNEGGEEEAAGEEEEEEEEAAEEE
jgi:hypothetical protein